MGRTAMGVIGMNLEDGDEIVGMQLNTQGDSLLIVSEKGMGKRTRMDEFSVQKRGGKGVKCYKIADKTGNVIGVKAVNDSHEIISDGMQEYDDVDQAAEKVNEESEDEEEENIIFPTESDEDEE